VDAISSLAEELGVVVPIPVWEKDLTETSSKTINDQKVSFILKFKTPHQMYLAWYLFPKLFIH
jgi:hypothetical protein